MKPENVGELASEQDPKLYRPEQGTITAGSSQFAGATIPFVEGRMVVLTISEGHSTPLPAHRS